MEETVCLPHPFWPAVELWINLFCTFAQARRVRLAARANPKSWGVCRFCKGWGAVLGVFCGLCSKVCLNVLTFYFDPNFFNTRALVWITVTLQPFNVNQLILMQTKAALLMKISAFPSSKSVRITSVLLSPVTTPWSFGLESSLC